MLHGNYFVKLMLPPVASLYSIFPLPRAVDVDDDVVLVCDVSVFSRARKKPNDGRNKNKQWKQRSRKWTNDNVFMFIR